MQKTHPKHLALWQIRLPLPGIVSILHRVSGVLLFIAIPFLLYLLQGSLSSKVAFEAYRAVISHPLVKLCLLGVLWSFFHHFFAGLRFLFLDIHKGIELNTARTTAKVVIVLSLLLTLIVGALAW
jgi:succinate dehydrogenase / fumarate reductase cytochrome b subunit